jgi:hypothetical protein
MQSINAYYNHIETIIILIDNICNRSPSFSPEKGGGISFECANLFIRKKIFFIRKKRSSHSKGSDGGFGCFSMHCMPLRSCSSPSASNMRGCSTLRDLRRHQRWESPGKMMNAIEYWSFRLCEIREMFVMIDTFHCLKQIKRPSAIFFGDLRNSCIR